MVDRWLRRAIVLAWVGAVAAAGVALHERSSTTTITTRAERRSRSRSGSAQRR
jgi:hypothetical protein